MRRVGEQALHVVAAIALAAAAWIVVRMLDDRPSTIAAGGDLVTTLTRWSTTESPESAHVELERTPSPEQRDWMAALERAGTAVGWGGHSPPATGLVVEPIPDPKHPVRLWVAAPADATVVVRDSLGMLASVRSEDERAGGVAITVPRVEGTVIASVNGTDASAMVRDTLEIELVLILGRAGWEGKFAMASLEERGWKVDARLRVSPQQIVVQGRPAPRIDIERYSVVIALDATAASHANAIEKYVRAGGGLIAIGEAAGLPAFASLLGADAAEPTEAGEFRKGPGEKPQPPRHALALAALGDLKEGAVALERGPREAIAAVARRVGDGRVLQVGYRDTWRWRMAGTEADPVAAHREWWSGMASSVARARRTPRDVAEGMEPTPLAALVASLGPPSKAPAQSTFEDFFDPRLLPWLFALAIAALLIEWTSRRLRGVP